MNTFIYLRKKRIIYADKYTQQFAYLKSFFVKEYKKLTSRFEQEEN